MDGWGWLIAYVVGFGLLQLLLYRYLQRRGPTANSTAGRGASGGTGSAQSASATEAGVRCESCGTVNEADGMIRYCRSCAESLQ
jgi:hypothetical protein